MNNQLQKTIQCNNELLKNLKPIDFATNAEIDKLLVEMAKIINNQNEILKKQEESIEAIQLSSDQ